jgi:NAD(P)H-dependent FMN reductase
MYSLKIIIASTRPQRKGPFIANWVYDTVKKYPAFKSDLVDLAEWKLPFLDEPAHPRLRQYQHEHTKKWSVEIDSADAFIMVTSEYNHSYPATLKNALDFLFQEWSYKPVAFVSYGGISGGTRSVQALKQVVAALKMMPMVEAVNIPFFNKYFDASGNFNPDETLQKSLNDTLSELERWTAALKTLRTNKA